MIDTYARQGKAGDPNKNLSRDNMHTCIHASEADEGWKGGKPTYEKHTSFIRGKGGEYKGFSFSEMDEKKA